MAKSLPIPNIDMGGTVAVIDESVMPPRWKKLERVFATVANAKRVLAKHGHKSGWLLDDMGSKQFIRV